MSKYVDPGLKSAVRDYFKKNYVQLAAVPRRQTQLLEVAALSLVVEHYRCCGFTIVSRNVRAGRIRVKTGARGYPWNFSHFLCERDNDRREIHSNLSVYSCRDDGGIYCLDVGVVQTGIVPVDKIDEWSAAANDALFTFAEVKKLVVYPMLLAHFVGIVHEVKSEFLKGETPEGFAEDADFDPALLTVSGIHGGSNVILDGFDRRGIRAQVVSYIDVRIREYLRGEFEVSPLLVHGGAQRLPEPAVPNYAGPSADGDEPAVEVVEF